MAKPKKAVGSADGNNLAVYLKRADAAVLFFLQHSPGGDIG
jgi:hypothetical protein